MVNSFHPGSVHARLASLLDTHGVCQRIAEATFVAIVVRRVACVAFLLKFDRNLNRPALQVQALAANDGWSERVCVPVSVVHFDDRSAMNGMRTVAVRVIE